MRCNRYSYQTSFRCVVFSVALLLISASTPLYADIDFYGFVNVQGVGSQSTTSWNDGGFGRFDNGDSDADSLSTHAQLEGRLALNWDITERFSFNAHTLARVDNARSSADDIGIVEAYFEYLAFENPDNDLTFSLGKKFFPSALEAADELWLTPYTINFSALNSWIAHEFRPIGLEVDYFQLFGDSAVNIVVNAFRGNDAAGAQLAWGGWHFSQRLSVYDEVLPLPPLFSLQDSGPFWRQRDSGSKPFSEDLDGRWGYAALIEVIPSENFRATFSTVDNRGDLYLYGEEYSWYTEFSIAGAHWTINNTWEVLGEFNWGETAMGPYTTHVAVEFETAYLLASWNSRGHRISMRYDVFEINDTDGAAENNDEDGHGLTLAYIHNPNAWRFAVELSRIDADRIAAVQSGFSRDTSGTQLTLEVRYSFD